MYVRLDVRAKLQDEVHFCSDIHIKLFRSYFGYARWPNWCMTPSQNNSKSMMIWPHSGNVALPAAWKQINGVHLRGDKGSLKCIETACLSDRIECRYCINKRRDSLRADVCSVLFWKFLQNVNRKHICNKVPLRKVSALGGHIWSYCSHVRPKSYHL